MTTIEQRIAALEARLDAMADPLPPPSDWPWGQVNGERLDSPPTETPDKADEVAERITKGLMGSEPSDSLYVAAVLREAYPNETAKQELLRDAVEAIRQIIRTNSTDKMGLHMLAIRAKELGI